jgi:hypothetical protein
MCGAQQLVARWKGQRLEKLGCRCGRALFSLPHGDRSRQEPVTRGAPGPMVGRPYQHYSSTLGAGPNQALGDDYDEVTRSEM